VPFLLILTEKMVLKYTFYGTLACLFLLFFASCQKEQAKELPFLGQAMPQKVISTDGQEVDSLIYPKIPDFIFYDQDSQAVSLKTFEGKIYVADFFFTTCPDICPLMKAQMKRVHQAFKDEPSFAILSHTINPRDDSVHVLKAFSEAMGVYGSNWTFVTGEREKIYEIAQKHYLTTTIVDSTQRNPLVHSGYFTLIDKERHLRGAYAGTEAAAVDRLIEDIKILLASYKK